MSCILHLFLCFILPGSSIVLDLKHLEHALRQRVKVSSSNYKHLGFIDAYLDSLEIMREIETSLNLVISNSLVFSVINVEFLGVFLHDEYVETFDDGLNNFLDHLYLLHKELLRLWSVLDSLGPSAFLYVGNNLIVGPGGATLVWTLEYQLG